MRTIRLGKTGLQATEVSFGALPIQRISFDEAERILRRAHDAGITFFDTARAYSDSEEKMGRAFAPIRKNILIATKTQATSGEQVTQQLETSLGNLKTDYVDILQIHNPASVPFPDDGTGRYEAMLRAKEQGKIRHIGLTNHRIERALQAAESGLYTTIQYPFSMLSSDREIALVDRCRELDLGFIAMKGLAGGLIRNIPAAFAFMRGHETVVPIWGIQKIEELEEFLALQKNPPAWDETMRLEAEKEKESLGKDFCRGCGYCLPCEQGIPIPILARMRLFLGRGPWQRFVTPKAQEDMARAEQCTHCGLCASRCPYELDTPELVRFNYACYKDFLAEKRAEGLL
jgi:aryl-alcohol dehydrogenase-like predicted oxidoreductase